ncbi:hypothetical protein V8E36_001963, partial [Tilletia maclaganii]
MPAPQTRTSNAISMRPSLESPPKTPLLLRTNSTKTSTTVWNDYRVPTHPLTVRPERASKETSLTLARLRVSSERTVEQNKGQSQTSSILQPQVLISPGLYYISTLNC